MTHMINPKITSEQKFVIIGTILGGSSIVKPQKGKNCYLSMRNKNLNWLKFKAEKLKDFASQSPIIVEKTNRWHSMCYPIFNDFHKMFYKGKKRVINIEDLNLLHDSSLAIWYGDAGIKKNNQVILNTNIWGKSGTETMVEYFSSLDWKVNVFLERKKYRIKFEKESTEEFLNLIRPYLPEEK